MNLGQAKERALALLDEYSNNGALLGHEYRGRMDYVLRFPMFFDLAQKQAALAKPVLHRLELTQQLSQNLVANGFQPVLHEQEDLLYYAGRNAGAYAVSAESGIYLQIESQQENGVWRTVLHRETEPTGEAVPVMMKGLLQTENKPVRIRLTGPYRYTVFRRAVYQGKFTSSEQIPEPEPWIGYPLPDGFLRVRTLLNDCGEPWENYRLCQKELLLPWLFQGTLQLTYEKMPDTITTMTPDTAEFEVSEDAQTALPYFVAAQCLLYEEPEAANYLTAQFQNLLLNLRQDRIASPDRVKNALFGQWGRRIP